MRTLTTLADYKHGDADPQGYHGEPTMKRSKRSHVGHKIKGVDRGVINVVNAPMNPKPRVAEATVKFGKQNIQLDRLCDTSGAVVAAYNAELSPGVWATASAPQKGTGKGDRIKDSINVRSWVMRIKTHLLDTPNNATPTPANVNLLTGKYSVRFIILQILDDKEKVKSIGVDGYPYWAFMADSTSPLSWFESQNRNIASVGNKGHRYKVILDHVWPNVTRDHYEEIKLGPHVQTYDSADDSTSSIPVVGRFIAFFVYRSDDLSLMSYEYPYGMTIEHRLTYTDE